MEETHEHRMLRLEVARQMDPLIQEVKRLTDLVQQYDKEFEGIKNCLQGEEMEKITIFDEALGKMPLYSRIKVYLEMEYLNEILQGSDCCNDKEFAASHEWSSKAAQFIVNTVKHWEDQGKPERGQ